MQIPPEIHQAFVGKLVFSTLRPIRVNSDRPLSRHEILNEVDKQRLGNEIQYQLEIPGGVSDELAKQALTRYFVTILQLFRTWADVMPDSNAWCAQNPHLSTQLDRALEGARITPRYDMGGFLEESWLGGAAAIEEVASFHACVLFWRHVRGTNAQQIGFCKWSKCGSPFWKTSKKTDYCEQDCGRRDGSNRAHRAKRRDDNAKLLRKADHDLGRWLRTGSETSSGTHRTRTNWNEEEG